MALIFKDAEKAKDAIMASQKKEIAALYENWAEGERLAIMAYATPHGVTTLPGKIWVTTTGVDEASYPRTNIRSMGVSKDENWGLSIGIGYVVD